MSNKGALHPVLQFLKLEAPRRVHCLPPGLQIHAIGDVHGRADLLADGADGLTGMNQHACSAACRTYSGGTAVRRRAPNSGPSGGIPQITGQLSTAVGR